MTGPVHDEAPLRYLALGDSYTIGEGVAPELRWPVQFAALLRARGTTIAPPQIIARSGWATDELSAAIDEQQTAHALATVYAIVSLMIGVNDQYRGRNSADYATRFTGLLERAIGFAGGKATHVVVLSIPDWGTTTFARASGRDRAQISREIDRFNHVAQAICTRHQARWVDITQVTRMPANASHLVDDGLHPSAPVYHLWAEAVFAAHPM